MSEGVKGLNSTVIAVICISGFLYTVGFDASVFVNLALLILILACGFSYLFRGKTVKQFWLLLIALVVGPPLISSFLDHLFPDHVPYMPSSVGSLWLLLIAMIVVSILYVRHRWTRDVSAEKRMTNERQ